MEQIWSNCKLDLLGTKSVIGVANEFKPDENGGDSTKLDLKKLLFLRANAQKAISSLPTDIRYYLIDCIVEQIFVPFSGGAGQINRYSSHPARLLDQFTISRKELIGQSVNKNLLSSIFPAPALIMHSRIQASKTTSTPLDELKGNKLLSEAPAPQDDPENLSPSPSPLPGGYLEPEVNNPSPNHAVAPPEKKNNNTKSIIIAVVVTATVTLTLAGLCFCCFYRYLRNKYHFDDGQRDERPLLSLSLSDFSGMEMLHMLLLIFFFLG